ncbi:hypothetical protein FRB96_004453 [Tulasnella sp. 330]|nr:hypothetical protein FRB96_004453 [Tulasnella sp. 330]
MEFLGTPMDCGTPTSAPVSVNGHDSAALCAGTVYSVANSWLLETIHDGFLGQFVKRSKTPYPADEDKVEQKRNAAQLFPSIRELPGISALLNETLTTILYAYVTNPFHQINDTNEIDPVVASQKGLLLVDGSEAGQLIQISSFQVLLIAFRLANLTNHSPSSLR